MRRIVITALAAIAPLAFAQEPPAPEQCLAKANDPSAIVVMHDGKTYRMANDACRTQFLRDPERYAQLYDALVELEAEGTPRRAETPSLVPS